MKTMKILTGALLISALFLLGTACNKEDNTPIKTDKQELTFNSDQTVKELKVLYDGDWTLQAEGLEYYYGPNMAEVKDFTITPASGNGDATLTVTLKTVPEESYDLILYVKGDNTETSVKLHAGALE